MIQWKLLHGILELLRRSKRSDADGGRRLGESHKATAPSRRLHDQDLVRYHSLLLIWAIGRFHGRYTSEWISDRVHAFLQQFNSLDFELPEGHPPDRVFDLLREHFNRYINENQ